MKTKIASAVSSAGTSSVSISGRPSVKISGGENKENLAPTRKDQHPPIKRSAAGMDLEHNDVDADVMDDPAMVAEYAPDIFAYMMELEVLGSFFILFFY